MLGSRDSSISKVTGLDCWWFESWLGQEILLYSIASRQALGPTQSLIQ
jgi:hypothetical protein